jgi:hypothetical protein
MSDQTRVSHPIYNLLPTEIAGFDSLAELALDTRLSIASVCLRFEMALFNMTSRLRPTCYAN